MISKVNKLDFEPQGPAHLKIAEIITKINELVDAINIMENPEQVPERPLLDPNMKNKYVVKKKKPKTGPQ